MRCTSPGTEVSDEQQPMNEAEKLLRRHTPYILYIFERFTMILLRVVFQSVCTLLHTVSGFFQLLTNQKKSSGWV